MNQRRLDSRRHDALRSQPAATPLTIGGAGMILLFSAGPAYVLAAVIPAAPATTAAALMTAGLVGLLVVAGVVAATRPRRDAGRGRDPARPEPVPIPIRSTGEVDAELFRILDDARLGDLRLNRRGHRHDRRRGTA